MVLRLGVGDGWALEWLWLWDIGYVSKTWISMEICRRFGRDSRRWSLPAEKRCLLKERNQTIEEKIMKGISHVSDFMKTIRMLKMNERAKETPWCPHQGPTSVQKHQSKCVGFPVVLTTQPNNKKLYKST